MDFMGFVPNGKVGFFHGGDGWFLVAKVVVMVMGFFVVVVVSFLWQMWW